MALDTKKKLAIGIFTLVIIIAIICGLVFGLKSAYCGQVQPILSLEIRPKSNESTGSNTSIRYYQKKSDSIKYYVDDIEKFVETYTNASQHRSNFVHCNYVNPTADNKVCNVDLSTLEVCNSANSYGYTKSTPCIFLTLTKIADWIPELYNDSNKLPQEMPRDLQDYIINLHDINMLANMIWVSCEGVNSIDIQNMGPIVYFPDRGFPAYYFPFKNIDGYVSPIVAVYFEKPKIGVPIHIECTAWAKNIYTDSEEKRGVANLELYIN